jgi:predicted AAA+ superfamily ATPase
MRKWFISVNNMKLDACKKIIAEWLEEQVLFAAIRRQPEPMELGNLFEILAIVGPRRWGKTFFMYQLIRAFWGRLAKKEEVLFVDFDHQRL